MEGKSLLAGMEGLDEERALNEPLLPASTRALIEEMPDRLPNSTKKVSILNLFCTILGAGMFALPRAFAGLGLLGGAFMVSAVAAMTYLSCAVMLRASERTRRFTYRGSMESMWGKATGFIVQASVILACGGFLVLYLIVLIDVTIGGGDFSGVIPDLFPGLPDPLPWYLGRCAMLTWFSLAIAPLLAARTLGGLARVSAFKVACSLLCTAALVALAGAAGVQGKLLGTGLWPDPTFFGPGAMKILTRSLATVPVVMTALICQYSIHPIMQDLQGYTPGRMRSVVGTALGGSSLVYLLAGACGYAVFGRHVHGDVLADLDPEVVGDLIGGPRLGLALVASIKVCVALVMLTSFPLICFVLRADVFEVILLWTGGKAMGTVGFYVTTYTILLMVYATALLVKSAYQMTGMIGAICGIAVAFICPGLLAWRGERGWAWKLFAGVLMVVGLTLMAAGIAAPILDRGSQNSGSLGLPGWL